MSDVGADLDEVAAAIARGDEAAFAWWLARAEQALRRSLASFAEHVDVEAILQEAFVRVWQLAPRFEADGRSNGLLRLAARIARNLALDALRRERRAGPPVDPTTAPDLPVEPVEPDPLLRRQVELCIGALPRKPRQAIEKRLDSGGRDADRVLAESLGMQTNTFLQNLSRARRLLLECLERAGIHLSEAMR